MKLYRDRENKLIRLGTINIKAEGRKKIGDEARFYTAFRNRVDLPIKTVPEIYYMEDLDD